MRLRLDYLVLLSTFAASAAQADNNFSVGVEGFHDHYQEESATVNVSSNEGSITGGYEHTANGFFSAIDGRYSQGKEDYNSISGKLNGEKSWETDDRLRLGLDIPTAMWHGHLMPYVGGGWRYYFDEGKGLQTNLDKVAYDRHISQFYIPVGATYRFTSGNWTFAPNAEGDVLAYGQVNSHFAPVGAGPNITNQQHSGWGLRGEFMAGQQYKSFGWEIGPFVRYWHIEDSNCKIATEGLETGCWGEPANTRLQTGAALKVNF